MREAPRGKGIHISHTSRVIHSTLYLEGCASVTTVSATADYWISRNNGSNLNDNQDAKYEPDITELREIRRGAAGR